MRKNAKAVIVGLLAGVAVVMVNAYSTQIWAPIQFVKQLFVTPNGELDAAKAVIKIDGTNGTITAKSISVENQAYMYVCVKGNSIVNMYVGKDSSIPKDPSKFKCDGGSIYMMQGLKYNSRVK